MGVIIKDVEKKEPHVIHDSNKQQLFLDLFSDPDVKDLSPEKYSAADHSPNVQDAEDLEKIKDEPDQSLKPLLHGFIVESSTVIYPFMNKDKMADIKEFIARKLATIKSDFGFDKVFCPNIFYPVSYYITSGLGGMYPAIAERLMAGTKPADIVAELEDVLSFEYNELYNQTGAANPNLDHMVFCASLYLSINDIVNSELSQPKTFAPNVIDEWFTRLIQAYGLYLKAKDSSPDKRILEQAVHELMWDIKDNPKDKATLERKIVDFAWIGSMFEPLKETVDPGLDYTQLKVYIDQVVGRKIDDSDIFVNSEENVPYVDDSSFYRAAVAYETVPDCMREDMLQNYIGIWYRYGTHITIPANYRLAKDLMKMLPEAKWKHMIEEITDITGILDESIKTKGHNFYIDEEGTLLIEKKETSDFDQHFKHSTKLLKQYSKHITEGGSKEAYANELAKIYFMAKIIEITYMRPSNALSDDKKKAQKAMINLRATMLNAFGQYLKVYVKQFPDFNFTEYFEHSKYGEVVKISTHEIKGTIKVAKSILSGLGLLR